MYWDAKPIIYRNIYFLINENTTTCSSFPFVINNGLLIWLNTQNSLSFPPPSADGVHLEEQKNHKRTPQMRKPVFLHGPGDSVNGIRGHFFFSQKPSHALSAGIFSSDCPFPFALAPRSLQGAKAPVERAAQSGTGTLRCVCLVAGG